MTSSPATIPVVTAEGGRGVRRSAVSGALWSVSGAASNKLVTAVGQVALAWLLSPLDFGVASIAFAVASVAGLLGSGGLRQVLVQQGIDSQRATGQAFWIALSLDAVMAALLVAAAPVAGRLFGDHRVGVALLVIAAGCPIQSLSAIYAAQLMRTLRFRALALIHATEGAVRTAGAVALAASGFGPYSLVLPLPIGYAVSAATTRIAAGRLPIRVPRPATWSAWVPATGWATLLSFVSGVQAYVPTLVLGLFASSAEVGAFAWGYALAGQALFLAAISLKKVLFPSFVALDAARRPAAFVSAARAMWIVSTPLCVLQAVVARELIPYVFGTRWSGAAPVVVWTSLGLLALPLDVLSESALLAAGRFRLLNAIKGLQLGLLLLAALAGGLLGRAEHVAAAVATVLLIGYTVSGLIAVAQIGGSPSSLLCALGAPAAALAGACAVAGIAQAGLPQWSAALRSGCVAAVFILSYAAMVRWLARDTVVDLLLSARARFS